MYGDCFVYVNAVVKYSFRYSWNEQRGAPASTYHRSYWMVYPWDGLYRKQQCSYPRAADFLVWYD